MFLLQSHCKWFTAQDTDKESTGLKHRKQHVLRWGVHSRSLSKVVVAIMSGVVSARALAYIFMYAMVMNVEAWFGA